MGPQTSRIPFSEDRKCLCGAVSADRRILGGLDQSRQSVTPGRVFVRVLAGALGQGETASPRLWPYPNSGIQDLQTQAHGPARNPSWVNQGSRARALESRPPDPGSGVHDQSQILKIS